MSLALVLAEAGRPTAALREIDRAAPVLDGLPAARLQMQRALILDRLNRFAEAMAGYSTAIAVFRRADDQLWQARALTNRGVLHSYRGSLRQAESDLVAAERIYTALGQDLAVAQVRHNLGYVRAVGGDIPGAMRWYDVADEYFAATTRPAIALMDRGELLLRARLLPEARSVAEAALSAARASRMRLFEAQARLMLAEITLAVGDRAAADGYAATAYRSFRRQHRPAWAALARYVALRAADDPSPARHRRTARQVAADLAITGWVGPALDARLYAARLAPGHAEAVAELREVRRIGRHGTAELRARAWHAEALLRDAAGDPAGARRALLAGARILEAHQAALGATELRALAGGYATDLATTGLRLALRTGRASSLLWWAERWKGLALRLPPTRPPDEEALATDLAELRRLGAEAGADVTDQRQAVLRRRQRLVEERIRRRSWQARGQGTAPAVDRLDGNLDQLGGRTLVELVEIDGDLHAVVVRDGRARTRRLCRTAEVTAELDALRFALRRVVLRHGRPASRQAAADAARYAAGRLDELLFAPLRPWLGDGEWVLVPVGALHATPWALLPSCHGRPVTVAPSAAAWSAATRRAGRHPDGGRPLLVAGPGLAHAETEVRQLAGLRAPAQLLVGTKATADAVLAALDGTASAHIAAHGTFRADNPMFSHLRLADGPLTVYDLERLTEPPSVVVLSACDAGLSAVHPGEELMGLAAALLGLGTATVVASVLPARDNTALTLMAAFYRRLAEGAGPAEALAAAQAGLGDGVDEATATAAAFVCFGSG
ncbi:CHAT domain-containing protein [Plantactinospora endophytica]|nr:CHAT domain-containing protein [Plantactinospora endophytica]